MYAATPQRSRVSSSRKATIQHSFTHVEIFTKQQPLPTTIRSVQPKGFIACQSRVSDSFKSYIHCEKRNGQLWYEMSRMIGVVVILQSHELAAC